MPRRILLLFPQLNNMVFFGVYEPLVLEIFSAIAKEEGNDVELVDLRLEPDGCERLARTGYVPELIGLTTHGFAEVPIVNDIARRCKALWPDAVVIIGGGQATVSPELFDRDVINVIVRGPGERVWRDLCREGVQPGTARVIEDPDPPRIYSYPVPDRAITVGIGTILESRTIVLLASGASKADAIARLASAPPGPEFPASALLGHLNVLAIVDRAAFAKVDASVERRSAARV